MRNLRFCVPPGGVVASGTVKLDKSYGQVAPGKSVKLKATLKKGYAFLGWFYAQTGARLSQAMSYSLKMGRPTAKVTGLPVGLGYTDGKVSGRRRHAELRRPANLV